jgi:hypothetical protein
MSQAATPTVAKPRRRWFQFSVRTLLILTAVIPAAIGGGIWWVTAPMKTWREFCARVAAGDLAGANALCGPSLRIVKGDAYGAPPSGKDGVGRLPLRFLQDSYDGQVAPRDTPESLTCQRTWADILCGRATTRMAFHYDQESGGYWRVEIHAMRVTLVRISK